MFKNALISVSDKTGLVEFVKPLAEQGMRIVSSGGTAKHLKAAGIEVVEVHEQTGFPEVMDGRVKTLHPNIHMALLARQGNSQDMAILKDNGLDVFDLVVVNLYPFKDALKKGLPEKEQVEFIDIGGPSMLRAAAKNFERIAVVTDPVDYQWIQEKKELTQDDRKGLAAKLFAHTAAYDAAIAQYLTNDSEFVVSGTAPQELRYGENPHQKANWYQLSGESTGWHEAEILQGKALSFNNLLDLEAAARTLSTFEGPTVISVKHNNACGVGRGDSIDEALERSLSADPVSVFGGIIALNHSVTENCAEKLSKLFLECIVAPDFDSEAIDVLQKKKNLRCLKWNNISTAFAKRKDIKHIAGGVLVQDMDEVALKLEDWKFFGEKPDESKMAHLQFAWKVCAHLKSNAIAITTPFESVGFGMGQVNRVDAVEQAIKRAKEHHGDKNDFVLASDAFFPFPDSIEKIADAGIKWVIQPGGSIKDEDVIARAKELGVNMVFTGVRHFRH